MAVLMGYWMAMGGSGSNWVNWIGFVMKRGLQKLTVHQIKHLMALLTMMAETTWTVCWIAKENLKQMGSMIKRGLQTLKANQITYLMAMLTVRAAVIWKVC